MIEKTPEYHESAVEYNNLMAIAAAETGAKVSHPVVKEWCGGIERQHQFHSKQHSKALKRLLEKQSENDTTNDISATEPAEEN